MNLLCCKVTIGFGPPMPQFSLGDLKTGGLLEIPFGRARRHFILGPAVGKPRLQVLLEVTVGNCNQISFFEGETKEMKWFTSAQIFQAILDKCGLLSCLNIKVYKYEFPLVGSLLVAHRLPESATSHTLTTVAQRKPQKRKNATLPFGLKMPQIRKRKKTTCNKDRKEPLTHFQAKDQHAAVESALASLGLLDVGEEAMSSDTSSTSTSSSTASEFDSEGEELPVCPDEKKEEKEIRQVLERHVELNANTVGEAASSSQPVQNPTVAGRVQCSPNTGIVEISRQVHGRLAVCRGCNEKISKQSVRIGYCFNVKKFRSYTHVVCFKQYLQRESGDPRQACQFIESWLDSHDCEADMSQQLQALVSDLLWQKDQKGFLRTLGLPTGKVKCWIWSQWNCLAIRSDVCRLFFCT